MADARVAEHGTALNPHPYELEQAIVGDHVVVFGYLDDGIQFEVSGETDAEELNIDWTKIELEGEDVAAMLEDHDVYEDWGEDLAGRSYNIQVRAGIRHPKGTPVHTRVRGRDEDGVSGFCRACGTDFENLPEDDYEREVAHHIQQRHDHLAIDEVVVVRLTERGSDE